MEDEEEAGEENLPPFIQFHGQTLEAGSQSIEREEKPSSQYFKLTRSKTK